MNQYFLVGRIVEDFKQKENDKDNKTTIKVAVNRSFKNADGIYETDFMNITLFGSMSVSVMNYVKKGDLIGIKGHVQTCNLTVKDTSINVPELIADKVSFLSSSMKGNSYGV